MHFNTLLLHANWKKWQIRTKIVQCCIAVGFLIFFFLILSKFSGFYCIAVDFCFPLLHCRRLFNNFWHYQNFWFLGFRKLGHEINVWHKKKFLSIEFFHRLTRKKNFSPIIGKNLLKHTISLWYKNTFFSQIQAKEKKNEQKCPMVHCRRLFDIIFDIIEIFGFRKLGYAINVWRKKTFY